MNKWEALIQLFVQNRQTAQSVDNMTVEGILPRMEGDFTIGMNVKMFSWNIHDKWNIWKPTK